MDMQAGQAGTLEPSLNDGEVVALTRVSEFITARARKRVGYGTFYVLRFTFYVLRFTGRYPIDVRTSCPNWS